MADEFAAAYQSECAARSPEGCQTRAAPQPGGLLNKSGKDAATPRGREAARPLRSARDSQLRLIDRLAQKRTLTMSTSAAIVSMSGQ